MTRCPDCGSSMRSHIAKAPCTDDPNFWHEPWAELSEIQRLKNLLKEGRELVYRAGECGIGAKFDYASSLWYEKVRKVLGE